MRMTLVLIFSIAAAGGALAQGMQEPPIQSPQDAACREDARAKVFTAVNPNGLSLYDLGSQIYHVCMASYHATAPNPGRQEHRFKG